MFFFKQRANIPPAVEEDEEEPGCEIRVMVSGARKSGGSQQLKGGGVQHKFLNRLLCACVLFVLTEMCPFHVRGGVLWAPPQASRHHAV